MALGNVLDHRFAIDALTDSEILRRQMSISQEDGGLRNHLENLE